MAPAWIVIILMASVQGFHPATGVFSSKHDLPQSENVFEKEAKNICPPKCDCKTLDSKLVIDCGSKNLVSFPDSLPLLVYKLDLVGNGILNLSYNSSLKTLNSLNVSSNLISGVDSKWIGSLESLKFLDISLNKLRSKAIENAFNGVQLLHLDLSNNQLDMVTDAMFPQMNSLVSLNLSFNEIERIAYDGFYELSELVSLDLSHNKLVDVHHEWLKNLQNLQKLVLKNNNIKFLRNVVFSTLKNLQVLDLSENSIKSVGLLSFKGLGKLQLLNVSHNDISHLQEGVFRSLELAEVIDLSDNSVTGLNNIFTHARSLEYLHLKNLKRLKELTFHSLAGTSNLKHLDLSGSSSLAEIYLKAFSHSPNLKVLDLSNANITNLKMGVLDNLRRIETLKLSGNPWQCDCYMYWLLMWLGEHGNSHLLSPSETKCLTPTHLESHVLLDALDHSMTCTNATIQHYTNRTKFKVGSPAFLECNADGSPMPKLTWITPQKETFYWDGFRNVSLTTSTSPPDTTTAVHGRFRLTGDGYLAIDSVERGDGGFYVCIASNPLSRDSVSIRLTLDYSYLVHIKIVSVLVGLATSFGFLLVTLVSVLVRMVMRHFGVRCIMCRNGNASPRSQQIKKILESMEHYKRQQLDRLRGNYNMQVQKIKDNCMQQMERLRESYSSQAECLRDFKEYGTLQIDRIRENYYSQVQRVRDYSASQIVRLRGNYLYQRNRIRKFSAHHLYKLRENYKVQQQHLNKILENLNLESCRNVCQRTESVVFDTPTDMMVPKICLLPPLHTDPMDANNDSSSQISAYFTPDEAGSEASEEEENDPLGDVVPSRRNVVASKNVVLRIEDKATSTSDISGTRIDEEKCYSNETMV